jgi:diadenosine tetraphosphatase ApaH/serine/threonine PP2A family protein phosphatase
MGYAILGDIHANLEALEEVLSDLSKKSTAKIFSVGDIVGYGPDPSACIEIAKAKFDFIAIGNHDLALIGELDLDNLNDTAQDAIIWSQSRVEDDKKDFLRELPFIEEYGDMVFAHSSLYRPETFGHILSTEDIRKSFDIQEDKKAAFIGHSHIPAVFMIDDISGDILEVRDETLNICQKKRYLINVGSVGQPRDGDPRACYVYYDDLQNTISIERVDYDIDKTVSKIVSAGLSDKLAARLLEGV